MGERGAEGLFSRSFATVNIALDDLGELGLDVTIVGGKKPARHCDVWDGASGEGASFKDTLFVTHGDNFPECRARHDGPILLVLRADEAAPELAGEDAGRVSLARKADAGRVSLNAIASRVSESILKTDAWAAVLSALRPPNTLQDLLDFSFDRLPGYAMAVDEDNAIIASTRVDASDSGVELEKRARALLAESVEVGVDGDRDELMRLFAQSLFVSVELGVLASAMKIGNRYLGGVFLFGRAGEAFSPGTVDTFLIFARLCTRLAARSGTAGEDTAKRRAALLDGLLAEPEQDELRIERECEAVGLPYERLYRLVLVDGAHNALANTRSLMVSNLQARFPLHMPFVHEGETLLLVMEEQASMKLSDAMVGQLEGFCAQRQCSCYSSDAFGGLGLLWYAYREIQATRMVRHDVDVLRAPLESGCPRSGSVYQFYEAIMFLGDTDWYGPEFLNESYRMLPLLGVIERDRDEGTDDLVVLYCYLSLGRRVGKAAERLHMHRNNVRYRIDAMRRRYGFDLDDSLVCTRLLNDYRFMIARSPEFREGLLGRLR